MALNEADRRELLAGLGLAPDGDKLSLAPRPEAQATKATRPVPTPVETDEGDEPEPIDTGVEDLTDEQLLQPGAFDIHKLAKSQVGKLVSSPHNKRLYTRIQEAKVRQQEAERDAKAQRKKQRKSEERTHVKEKVQADTAAKVTEAVLEAMQAQGIDLDALAALLKGREG